MTTQAIIPETQTISLFQNGKKSQFQDWLKDHKIPFRPDALRTELWMLYKIHGATNTSKVIDNIAKRYGHEVLHLPPYHCDRADLI